MSTNNEVAMFQQRPSISVVGDQAVARATQEVQAAMVIAKKFPRDETAAYNRIMNACKRKALAESALYAYPRGGTTVTGPSIRLAEALVQNWGNIDFGIIELENKNGESQVMSYAWDLETNTRQTKVFAVKHERKAQGVIKKLDDPRDIYEMIANQGARRLRACILGVIPGDVIEAAIDACDNTLKTGSKEPLIDRARKMVGVFREYGVTQSMIEARIGHNIDAISEQEMVNLRKIFTSLKDGAAKREDFFKVEQSAGGTANASTLFGGAKTAEPADDIPMDAPTPAPKKESKPSSINYVKGLRGLMELGHVTEAEFLDIMRATADWDDSLGSLEEVSTVAPTKLEHAYENWNDILTRINAMKEGAK